MKPYNGELNRVQISSHSENPQKPASRSDINVKKIYFILAPKLNNFEENFSRAKPKTVNRSASRARSSRTTSSVRIGTRVDDFI